MIPYLIALLLLVLGWIGLHVRQSVLGGTVAVLIVWQGLLAMAALMVFQRPNSPEGAILIWTFAIGALLSTGAPLVLGLRRYYSDKEVSWRKNEGIRY